MEPILVGNLIEQVNDLSEDGFRVLAIANKKVSAQSAYSKADEENLVLTGYLAFLDPPKETSATAITAHGAQIPVWLYAYGRPFTALPRITSGDYLQHLAARRG